MSGKRLFLLLSVALVASTAGCGSQSQPDGLDRNFGTDVRLEPYHSVAVDRSGRLLVASSPEGRQVGLFFDMRMIVLSRFDRDGRPDKRFGKGGAVTVTTPGWDNAPFGVVQAPDGSIALAANSTHGQSESLTNGAWTVARFDSGGLLDRSFGSNGLVWVRARGQHEDAGGLRLLPWRRHGFLLVGSVVQGPAVLVALTRSGHLAPDFGHNGRTTVPLGATTYDGPELIAALPSGDGGVTLVVQFAAMNPSGDGTLLIRVDARGEIDRSFGRNGRLPIFGPHALSAVSGATLAPDGSLILAGDCSGAQQNGVMRLRRDGRPERGFGARGLVCFSSPWPWGFISVGTDASGILIGGPNGRVLLRRLTTRGRFDKRFGSQGVVASAGHRRDYETPQILVQDRHHVFLVGALGPTNRTVVSRVRH